MLIEGKSAMVTGGASGLGLATVRKLHSLGAKVLIADLNQKAGKALEHELGEGTLFVETDVTQETSLRGAVEVAVQHHGGIHLLVNCAGIAIAEKILSQEGPHDLEHFTRVIQVNLIGTFNALRLTASAMAPNQPNEEGERGIIVTTASVAAFEGQIGQAAYAASKGGIVALTLPAARELARLGIRVVSIAPGIFDTTILILCGVWAAWRTAIGRPANTGRQPSFTRKSWPPASVLWGRTIPAPDPAAAIWRPACEQT